MGQNAEAERLIERALAIRLKSLGADHAEVARSIYVLAGVQEKRGRIEDALRQYQRACDAGEDAHA